MGYSGREGWDEKSSKNVGSAREDTMLKIVCHVPIDLALKMH